MREGQMVRGPVMTTESTEGTKVTCFIIRNGEKVRYVFDETELEPAVDEGPSAWELARQ